MSDVPKKIIIVDDCIQCPIIGTCKEWAKLTKKQKFVATCGVGVDKVMLRTCPLADYPNK